MTEPKNGRSEHMRRLNADPDFAAARDERAREVIRKHGAMMARKSKIARRGVDVPKHMEDQWRELKVMKVSNREAAKILGLTWLGESDDTRDMRAAMARSVELINEIIDLLEDETTRIDPDDRWVVVDRLQRVRRVCEWNLPQQPQKRA